MSDVPEGGNGSGPTPEAAGDMDFVMDIPVELTVELGSRRVRIGELLRLGPGSVVELDKPAGDALDIYANRRLVARGEAVVVGERYGVRVTELLGGRINPDRLPEKEPS